MRFSWFRRFACLSAFSALTWACGTSSGTSSGSSGASGTSAEDASVDAQQDSGPVETVIPAASTFIAVCQLIQKVDLRGMLHVYGEVKYGPIDPKLGKATEATMTLSPLKLGTNTLDASVRVGTPLTFPKGPFSADGKYHESLDNVTIDKAAAATNEEQHFPKFDARFRNVYGNYDLCLNVTEQNGATSVIKCVTIQAKPTDTYVDTHDTLTVDALSGAIIYDSKPCD